MVAVPITFYLERRSRENAGLSNAPSSVDIQTATEIWYEKGFKEGMEHAKAACDAKLAAREEECKQWIEAARKVWTEAEGAVLGRQIADATACLKTDIADAVARILRPLAAQKLADEALSKLVQEIEKLLSFEDAIHLKISGPADLVFELRKNIPSNAIVTVLAGDKPEVTVVANKTVIETKLGEWLARVGVDSDVQEGESKAGTPRPDN
jgi:hypothetical protein